MKTCKRKNIKIEKNNYKGKNWFTVKLYENDIVLQELKCSEVELDTLGRLIKKIWIKF